MTDKADPRGGDGRPDALRKGFSRRNFLQGFGALSLAALAPGAARAAGALETAAAKPVAPARPLLGALFNPYHRPEDWTLLARHHPEGMPLLGAYGSDAAGSVTTQIIWARMMGAHFFLAAYCPGRPSREQGVAALFEAAERAGYTVGLYVDLGDGGASQPPTRARLEAALQQVRSLYLSHSAYLRTASGLPVLGVAGLDDGSLLEAALPAAGGPGAWGPVLRFPAAWRSTPDPRVHPELARAVDHHGLYLGFSAHHGGSRAIPCHAQAASAVLVAPVRDEAEGIRLPPLAASPAGPAYVILDSFNNWGLSVPLEPGTRSQRAYVRDVAEWAQRHAA